MYKQRYVPWIVTIVYALTMSVSSQADASLSGLAAQKKALSEAGNACNQMAYVVPKGSTPRMGVPRVRVYTCDNLRAVCRVGIPLVPNTAQCDTNWLMRSSAGPRAVCTLSMVLQQLNSSIAISTRNPPNCKRQPDPRDGAITAVEANGAMYMALSQACEKMRYIQVLESGFRPIDPGGEGKILVRNCVRLTPTCHFGPPFNDFEAVCTGSFYLQPVGGNRGPWGFCYMVSKIKKTNWQVTMTNVSEPMCKAIATPSWGR